MALKIIVTDSDSSLGRCIVERLEQQSFNAIFLKPDSIDWQDPAATADSFALHQPDIVINCGLPSFYAEQPAFDGFALVSEAVARACLLQDVICIHLSSFEVYPVEMRRPGEEDQPSPDSLRAQALIRADEAILAMNHSIVLRLGWLVGRQGDNMLTRLLEQLRNSSEIALNPVFRGSPTTFYDVARVIVAMIKQIDCGADNWGVMHYCAEGHTTELGFAEVVANKLDSLSVAHCEYKPMPEGGGTQLTASRSGLLDVTRCTANFGIQPLNWQRGVEDIIHTLVSTPVRLTGS